VQRGIFSIFTLCRAAYGYDPGELNPPYPGRLHGENNGTDRLKGYLRIGMLEHGMVHAPLPTSTTHTVFIRI
jgi:hypothetical protein